jgi:hypothetical protein
MPCRPLRSLPSRISYDLPSDWAAELRCAQPDDVRVDDASCGVLREHIEAFSNGVRIARYSADVKAVQEQLDVINRRADNVLKARTPKQAALWTEKLCTSLQAPSTVSDKSLARVIALEELSEKFVTLLQQQNGQPLTTDHPVVGTAFLSGILWDKSAIEWLTYYCKKLREEVARNNSDQFSIIKPLGHKLINGIPNGCEQ